jgi:phage-related tail protein
MVKSHSIKVNNLKQTMTTKIDNLHQTFMPKINRLKEKIKDAQSTFTTKVKNLTKQDKDISNKLGSLITKLNDSTRAQAVCHEPSNSRRQGITKHDSTSDPSTANL